MRFDHAYSLLWNFQESNNLRMLLLSEASMRDVYDCIIATEARDCLELGTGYGATTCVMAAALEEIGGGMVTTVDQIGREPFGVGRLAQVTGLTQYVRTVTQASGYNSFLRRVLYEQTREKICQPCFDFCFLDGAHEWDPDALAALVAVKLLRPGAWLMLDDLNFKLRGCHPGWEEHFADRTEEELDAPQVGMVFDLLVQTHPDLDHFMVSNDGHIGWARKIGRDAVPWLPNGVICGAVARSWSETYDGVAVTQDAPPQDGVVIEEHGRAVVIRATVTDPNVVIRNPLVSPRAIDFVSLRIRLLAPDMETLQLFWIGGGDENFREEHSMRCAVRRSGDMQDLTFRFTGPEPARAIRLFRLDPADGPCVFLLESLTIGGW